MAGPARSSFTRELADVNGDGMEDIVGFGNAGVLVSLATGGGNFATPTCKTCGIRIPPMAGPATTSFRASWPT